MKLWKTLLILTLLLGRAASSEETVQPAAPGAEKRDRFLFLPARTNLRSAPVLFVFAPGAGRDALEYVPLMTEIQKQSDLRLAVAILKFTASFPNPLELPRALQAATEFATAQPGFAQLDEKHLIFGGHSLGGMLMRDQAQHSPPGGLVLFASFLPKGQEEPAGLIKTPLSVLTLGGERDGLTRMTRLAREWAKLPSRSEHLPTGGFHELKPVVILPEINHSLFASGKLQRGDFYSPLTTEAAHQVIGQVAGAFLNLAIERAELSEGRFEASRALLDAAVKKTGKLIEGFLGSVSVDDRLCEESQLAALNQSAEKIPRSWVTSRAEPSLFAFALSKPELALDQLEVVFRKSCFFNPLDVPLVPESVKDVACKMKSLEAVSVAVPGLAAGLEKTCAELNAATLARALALVSETQRLRYFSEGRRLVMGEDRQLKNGASWLAAGLKFQRRTDAEERDVSVHSPVLRTDLQTPKPFAGMSYCKLLPVSRAVEWILVDSFR